MKKTLIVQKHLADRLESFCQKSVSDVGEGELLFDQEVLFEDGMRMVIQVVAEQNQPAWTQGVLFDKNGNERGCSSVKDSFLGEYRIYDYFCEVIRA